VEFTCNLLSFDCPWSLAARASSGFSDVQEKWGSECLIRIKAHHQ
jgi:hypothetical protein